MVRTLGSKNVVLRGHRQSYARQVLDEQGIILRAGDRQVLGPLARPPYPGVERPRPWYQPGQTDWLEPGQTQRLNSVEVLKRLGLAVVRRPWPVKDRTSGKRTYAALVPWGREGDPLPKLPPHHWAEYSPKERSVRLHGPNAGPFGVGGWVPVADAMPGARPGAGRPMLLTNYREHAEKTWARLIQRARGRPVTVDPVQIPGMVLGVTDDGLIVTYPAGLKDMPMWLVVGGRGTGKSTFEAMLVSQAYWVLGWRVACLSSTPETLLWSRPNESDGQIKHLRKAHLGPLPVPFTYVYPSAREPYPKPFLDDVGAVLVLAWKEVLAHHRLYFALEKTQEYVARLVPALRDCRTGDDVLAVLRDGKGLEAEYEIPRASVSALRAAVENLLLEQVTNLSGQGSVWTVHRDGRRLGPYNPVTASVAAGLVPSVQISRVGAVRARASMYVAYCLRDLWMRQRYDADFGAAPLLLVFEELHSLVRRGNPSDADLQVRTVAREGRTCGVGFVGVDQLFTKLPDEVTGVATHLALFQNLEDGLASRYGLPIKDELKALEGHQAILHARSPNYFVVYDQRGHSRMSRPNEYFVVHTFPPLCLHAPPTATSAAAYSSSLPVAEMPT